MTLLAFLVPEWRKIILIGIMPAVLFLGYWPVLPESVRWLLLKRNEEKAQNIINRIARINKTEEPINLENYKEPTQGGRHEEDRLLEAFKSPAFVLRGLNICYCWLVVSMTYYGLSMNSASLAGGVYLTKLFSKDFSVYNNLF